MFFKMRDIVQTVILLAGPLSHHLHLGGSRHLRCVFRWHKPTIICTQLKSWSCEEETRCTAEPKYVSPSESNIPGSDFIQLVTVDCNPKVFQIILAPSKCCLVNCWSTYGQVATRKLTLSFLALHLLWLLFGRSTFHSCNNFWGESRGRAQFNLFYIP